MQNFYSLFPKAPTLRLYNLSIKNANQSILSPNIKSLRHRLHRKKKQPNPSSYEGVMTVQSLSKIAVMLSNQNFSKSGKCAENVFDQFLEPHNLSYTYPNQLILEPKLKRKMRRRHRKKNQPIWISYAQNSISYILSLIWIFV